MAYWDERELVDLIRHELRVEDDSGLCDRLIAPVTRRAKYGGLPLNFRMGSDDDDDEFADLQDYEISLYDEPLGTRKIVASRFRSRTADSDDVGKNIDVAANAAFAETCFVPVKQQWNPEQFTDDVESCVSRFVREHAVMLSDPLGIYSEFEAMDGRGKQILILYALEGHENEALPRLTITFLPTAKVSQVIGLCCWKYLQTTGKKLQYPLEELQLLMADESGEIDSDLPLLDRCRAIGDFGFPVLAMVWYPTRGEADDLKHVTVYFPNGAKFRFALPSLDKPLSWLVEETLKAQKEATVQLLSPDIILSNNYNLESVDGFDVPLNLDQSIESSGLVEFVMVRVNSKRGDFHPRYGISPPMALGLGAGSLHMGRQMSVPSIYSPGPASPTRMIGDVFDFAPMSPSEQDDFYQHRSSFGLEEADTTGVIVSFVVDRLHRYKPRWVANCVMRWTQMEIVPYATEKQRRRSFLPQQYQKITIIPWENAVCAYEVEKKRPNLDSLWRVTVWWLPVLDPTVVAAVVGIDDLSVRHIPQLYSNYLWKNMTLEARSKEDASEIARIVTSFVNARRDYPAFTIWDCSEGGRLHPAAAATAFMAATPQGAGLARQSSRGSTGRLSRWKQVVERVLRSSKD